MGYGPALAISALTGTETVVVLQCLLLSVPRVESFIHSFIHLFINFLNSKNTVQNYTTRQYEQDNKATTAAALTDDLTISYYYTLEIC